MRSAAMYGLPSSTREAVRTSRDTIGMNAIESATIGAMSPFPNIDTASTASTSPGIAKITSTMRELIPSTTPPNQADDIPITAPRAVDRITTKMGAKTLGAAPTSTREKMSRPRSSVPMRCSRLTGDSTGPT